MNIINGKLPNTILDYPIHTDFRVWINFQIQTAKVQTSFDLMQCIKSLFAVDIILTKKNINNFIQHIKNFIDNAKSYQNPNSKPKASHKHIIAFDYALDSNYIYSAFMEQYGIDLIDADLHYYKFVALFDCLKSDTLFKQIIEIRNKDLGKIKDKEVKKHFYDLKKVFEIQTEKPTIDKEALKARWGL